MVEYFHDFKMSLGLKEIVSKNKLRYKEDGYDLDLSYISRNIIAMGFPAETLERIYRNNINEVVKFFEEKHKDHYKIYNLCSETKRRYDTSKFKGMVVEQYSFQDHNPPPFYMLKEFCESLHKWLISDSNNVVAIHCKAGKGRTGLMICAYLVYTGKCIDEQGKFVTIDGADAALDYYGRQRTRDHKGVTIPSQKRYVHYFEYLVKHNLEYRPSHLRLTSLILTSIPVNNGGAYTLICEIYQIPKQKIESFEIEMKKGQKYLFFTLPKPLIIHGDVKLEFYIKKMKKKLFQFWFNTFFVGCGYDTDTYTIITEPCPHCPNGERISIPISYPNSTGEIGNGSNGGKSSSSSSIIITKNPNDHQPVIDLSFFDLIKNENSFDPCDCANSILFQSSEIFDSTTNVQDYCSNHNSNYNNPLFISSQQLPNTSVSSFKSSSSTSSSNSSSTQSLCNNTCNHVINYNGKKTSNPDMIQTFNQENLHLVLPKENLDQAYKDKSNKIFPANFKVVLKFNQDSFDGLDTTIISSNDQYICSDSNCNPYGYSESENITSEDDDDPSDHEFNNGSSNHSTLTMKRTSFEPNNHNHNHNNHKHQPIQANQSSSSTEFETNNNNLENKKGEMTYL
ncbi:phosphatase and tensin-like protein isoform X2 [Dermatophagoides farinae]|uniref:phosphatase and tensin-like protein isoform X2 n=1 Tax=Dermatophagoides farinae TaxID=6954 RepID=UPI003F609A5E